jgi:hypothetical protein
VTRELKKTPDLTRVFLFTATLVVFSCVSVLPETQPDSQGLFPAECQLNSNRFAWPEDHSPKLVWLSIDSLNKNGLESALRVIENPHPFGFKKILENANKKNHLKIQEPTITASSHISTITCSPAARHGTFANSQWSGSAMISGFVRPYGTETFATAIKNSGRKVVTAGYPTLDNQEPTRTVDEGFTYGTSLGRSGILKTRSQSELKHSWSLEEGLTLEVHFDKAAPFRRSSFTCNPEPCRITESGVDGIFDVTFSRPREHLRAYIQLLNESEVYFSQLKKSSVFPAAVSQLHRQCGLIFSPGKNPALTQYGSKATIGGMKHNLRYFSLNWAHYLPSTRADALFMYLEDLDALRHQFADKISFERDAVEHLSEVDKLVGEFLQSLPKDTNVVVLGDHGMSAVKTELNIRQIIPRNASEKAEIVSSGGSLFIYGRDSQSKNLNQKPSASELGWLRETRKKLLNFRVPGLNKKVFEQVFIKGSTEMQEAGLAHAEAPYLIAFSNPDFSIRDSLSSELILADTRWAEGQRPTPPGQHGHSSSDARMHTFVAMWGPELNTVRLNSVRSNLELVPAVGKALQWPVPAHCSY